MEIQTIQRYIHTSPRKLRLVADMIRKVRPVDALDILRITQKSAAKDLRAVIETVLANARQGGIDVTKVTFKRIEVLESTKMRRFRAGTRGRVKPYKRRMSHIKIVLTDDLNLKTQNSKLKTDKSTVTKEQENIETKDRAGQSSNASESKAGGRTGLSK